jgi:hydrogenase/urease accessory protein HupE
LSPSAFPASAQRRVFLWAIYILFAAGNIGKAEAHLVSGFNIRVVHFERHADGMTGYFRISLPLLVANGLGQMRGDQSVAHPAPYTFNRLESGRVFHYVDENAVRQNTPGLGRLAADGHRLMVAGKIIQPRVLSVSVHPKGFVPPFNTLDQVRAAVRGPAFPADVPETDVTLVLVDVAMFYPQVKEDTQFQFSSLLTPGKMGEPETNNMLFDHKGDTAVPYTIAGLLAVPVTVNPSLSEAFRQFLEAGIMHILEGWDHLLFIVCLVIGDFRFRSIALRITGFSVGHSLTLIAGFYGWIPAGALFPPLIEVVIALSILCAAMLILLSKRSDKLSLPLTSMVGLVHGFGFAFGLREMLAVSSRNLVPSLLSFNLGVEVGQLLIAFSCWSLLYMTQRIRSGLFSILRVGMAAASTVISAFWLLQRVPLALSNF